MKKKSMKKATTEKIFSKKVVKANKSALSTFKNYESVKEKIDLVKVYMGQKKIYKAQNNSTLHSKLNFNGIGSTQNIQINSGLA